MAETYTSLTERALAYLKEKIQNCELMPGEFLSEKRLCEEIGCGRTPVREALLRMKEEGLIEIFPRKGIRVAPFTRNKVCEIYQIRKLIEPAVCTRYFLRLDKVRLLEYDRQFQQVDQENDRAYYTLDFSFHRWLVGAAENETLDAFFAKLMQMQYRFSMYTARMGTAVKRNYYSEHHEIIEALLHENPERIGDALTIHANCSEIIALRTLSEAGIK
jgi:GntR family transcriptional regulator, rspAB operon transcriptional repressor